MGTGTVRVTRDESAGEAAIAVEGVRKRFGATTALDGVSLRVEPGTFVSLLGPSGCGKTTLLRIIGGFEHADAGIVSIHGARVDRLPPNRRPVNTVFQRYALFPHKTIFENIAFPLALQRVPRAEQRERVAEMLDLVRLPGIEARSPAQLSGGQAQRVALARALIGRPRVLLLDEPLAALDLKLRKAMQLELRRIQEELGTSFLYVTHDQEEALTMSDWVVLMSEGRIAQQGTPADVYERPANIFASGFIGEANLLPGIVAATDGTTAHVRLADGGAVVTAPANGVRPDQTVVVSVRPERLRIGRAGSANGAENRVPGRLTRRVFLGNIRREFVTIGPELVLVAQRGVDAEPIPNGETVEVSWHAANTILLPDEGDRHGH
jgi:spermidine/putrescine transport system ATP-binding protein